MVYILVIIHFLLFRKYITALYCITRCRWELEALQEQALTHTIHDISEATHQHYIIDYLPVIFLLIQVLQEAHNFTQ